MGIFNNKEQDEFKADYGFLSPHKTKADCKKPVFLQKNLHRIAVMKDFHIGSKGDIDEGGVPGYVSKLVCTGCGKRYTVAGNKSYFHSDIKT